MFLVKVGGKNIRKEKIILKSFNKTFLVSKTRKIINDKTHPKINVHPKNVILCYLIIFT